MTRQRFFILIKWALGWLLRIVVVLFLILFISLNIPQFQDFGRFLGVKYLQKKLGTTVRLQHFSMKFPSSVTLDSLYLEDRTGDTLLFSDHLYVGIDMLGLLSGKVHIDSIRAENFIANANRTLADTSFNFDYITDAFSSGKKDKKEKKEASSPPDIAVRSLHLSNVRLNFNDVVTGYHARIDLGDLTTHIDSLHPERVSYGVDSLQVKNTLISVTKAPSLFQKTNQKTEEETSTTLPFLSVRKVSLDHVMLNYDDSESEMTALANIDSLRFLSDYIDLPHQTVRLKKLLLNKSDLAFSYHSSAAENNTAEVPADSSEKPSKSWLISLDSLMMSENHLAFNDNGKNKQVKGIDYNHIDAKDFDIQASNLFYSADSSSLSLHHLAFKEHSGFNLKQLKSRIKFTDKLAALDDLQLLTDHSRISNNLAISYTSLDNLSKAPGETGVRIRLDSAIVDLRDVFYFQPALAKNSYFSGLSRNPIFLNTQIDGTLDSLNIHPLSLKTGKQTDITLSGILKQIIHPEQSFFHLQLNHLASGRSDLYTFLSPDMRPEGIAVPQQFSLKGDFNGTLSSFSSHLNLKSTDGNAEIRASAKNMTDTVRANYNAELILDQVRMDRILKNDTLYGPVTATMKVRGRGLTPATIAATLNGKIERARFRGYHYKEINLWGDIKDQSGNLHVESKDPHAWLELTAQSDFKSRYPAARLSLEVENADLNELNLTNKKLKIKGDLEADFRQLDINNPIGQIAFHNWELVTDSQQIALDTILLTASSTDSGHLVTLKGPVMDAEIRGNYQASEVGALLENLRNRYLTTDSLQGQLNDSLSSWHMDADLALKKSKLWHQIIPELQDFNGGKIALMLSSKPDSLLAKVAISPFTYQGITVDSIRFGMTPFKNKIRYILAGQGVESSFMDIPYLFLRGGADENGMTANLSTLDSSRKELYHLIANLKKESDGLRFNFLSDSLLLNNQKWEIPEDNYFKFSPEKLDIHHFKLQNGAQYLAVRSDSTLEKNQVEIVFNQFDIANITALFLKDSLNFEGTIDGKADLFNPTTNLTFTSDLHINDISFNKNGIGKLSLNVKSREKDKYDLNLHLMGDENEAIINGEYAGGKESTIDAKMNLKSLSMKTVEAFSLGQLKGASGKITGEVTIKGEPAKPHLNGDLHFEDASFILTQLNNYFALKNEHLTFNDQGLHLNHFTLLDSAGNKAMLDGDLLTKDYRHYNFNMSLQADHYQLLNKPKDKRSPYYGSVILTTKAQIKGDEALPVIDADLKLDKGTNFTLALLETTPQEVSSEGIVEFVNPDKKDSVSHEGPDSLDVIRALHGIDLSADISVDSNAVLNLIVDPASGDELSVRGKANLNYTISPGGESDLTGRFDILSGAYKMSFEKLIKRDFNIQRGSYVNWEGNPLKATMHITARYDVKAPAIDLIENQSTDNGSSQRNAYKQKLPFQVFLHMEGELLSPEISFELGMPEESRNAFDGSVYTRINQVNTVPSEVNKQTLGLLVFGHFIQDNPFESEGGGGTEEMVRESVNKILSQQLNNLAGDLIKGVDLNFNIESKQDFSSGDAENQTNLNVGVSKSLFNDRTTIYVGGDIPLEGSENNEETSYKDIVGDMAIDYKLSKDGRYRLRAYRQNKYEGVIEGEFIESGLSFIISMDYDKFKELFQRSND